MYKNMLNTLFLGFILSISSMDAMQSGLSKTEKLEHAKQLIATCHLEPKSQVTVFPFMFAQKNTCKTWFEKNTQIIKRTKHTSNEVFVATIEHDAYPCCTMGDYKRCLALHYIDIDPFEALLKKHKPKGIVVFHVLMVHQDYHKQHIGTVVFQQEIDLLKKEYPDYVIALKATPLKVCPMALDTLCSFYTSCKCILMEKFPEKDYAYFYVP